MYVSESEGDESEDEPSESDDEQTSPERSAKPAKIPKNKRKLPQLKKQGVKKPNKANESKKSKQVLPGPVEKILQRNGDQFLVKFAGCSYRQVKWLEKDFLEVDRAQLLRNFVNKGTHVEIDEDWTTVERIIAQRSVSKAGNIEYLTKWKGLDYSDATWEAQEALQNDLQHLKRYQQINKKVSKPKPKALDKLGVGEKYLPKLENGVTLRSYQKESVQWMAGNYKESRSCILGDEMGLGKTIQSISTLAYLFQHAKVQGPFLVVAPLTTLGHWQREVQTCTTMNVVVYTGGQKDRDIIEEHEFYYSGCGPSKRSQKADYEDVKFHVLLTSYDIALKDVNVLKQIRWAAAVFDEAHRLKAHNAQTRNALASLDIDWKLLLTGTPIQNNMGELYGILNFLDAKQYKSIENFYENFGGGNGVPPTVEQIQAVQNALKPVLLRRMKEDVETLPEKEEVIIWVAMTTEQAAYYKAIFTKQVGSLLAGASNKNLCNLRNLAMELRKVCCHPFLCNGLEDDMLARRAMVHGHLHSQQVADMLVKGSGKMLLLNKLLPKLKAEGHKVLIFSQFRIMLDLIEDYLNAAGYPFERVDGAVKGRDRQQAIDRFSKGDDENTFVFLLSTRAGGQGITLTAADTVIIYDSDWNPQNDLQAMARCHRIGQKKEVMVYRLICQDTYEKHVFECASRKYGLDEAILNFSAGANPEDDSKRIAELLRHGAHALGEQAAQQAEAFASEDINQILNNRTEKRQIGGKAGNSFSVAQFKVEEEKEEVLPAALLGSAEGEDPLPGAHLNDKEYWTLIMPEAVRAHHEQVEAAKGPVVLAPRRRTKVNYCDNLQSPGGEGSDKDDSYDGNQSNNQHGEGRRKVSNISVLRPAHPMQCTGWFCE